MLKNTILIVDDLEINRAILSDIFKKKYQIVEAENGEEAFKYIKENFKSIAAILLDVIMPKMNGIDLLKNMKKADLGQEIPVFLITADCTEEVMYEGYELGVKDILEKPFVPYFLKKRIENVIDYDKIKKEYFEIEERKLVEIKQLSEKLEKSVTRVSKDEKEFKTLQEISENLKEILKK